MNIEKILVANRGEIACRIFSTIKKMGKKSVAVYSNFDANAPHVFMADEAINIGGLSLAESYNNIEVILNAINDSGADAVHPGYGCMSENTEFVNTLGEKGIAFIGPSAKNIEEMGDKVMAKKIAKASSVNLVPGYIGEIKDHNHAIKIATAIGFPVMIKAAAGGGGKGMRLVHHIDELKNAIALASSEALRSFKDSRVFIEKYIQRPRHIEIQILGDKHGNVVCLGERECSIQRRHQKIIEEAPSSFVDSKLRAKMYKQSVSLAQSVCYHSAGTIEYIVDQEKNFYFMEMNTRIQVEHPVTELITGIDIVEQMINITEGKRLSVKNNITKFSGWAFESRVYAEDPSKDFLPAGGFVEKLDLPKNTRIESSITEGIEIGMFYDPMIMKICTHAKDRHAAIEKMQTAIENTAIRGVTNNLAFLQSISLNEDFINGSIDTQFIERHYCKGLQLSAINDNHVYDFIGVSLYIYLLQKGTDYQVKELSVLVNDIRYNVEASFNFADRLLKFKLGAKEIKLKSNWNFGDALFKSRDFVARVTSYNILEQNIELDGKIAKCKVFEKGVFELYDIVKSNKKSSAASNVIVAPITGFLSTVYVKCDDQVKNGDPLFVIEAMKVQNTFNSERSGQIKKVNLDGSCNVNEGDTILEFHKESK